MPKRITIHEEDYDRLRKMSREDAGLILHNLLHTLYGEPVEVKGEEYIDYFSENVCAKMMRFIELSETRSKMGSKGKGVSKTKAKAKQNESKTEAKAKPNTNTNTNTNTNIRTYFPANKFNLGAIVQDYDFKALEDKKVRN